MAEDSFVPEPIDPLAPVPIQNVRVTGDTLPTANQKYETEVKDQAEFDKRFEGVPDIIPSVAIQFKNGGNTAVNLYNDLERMHSSGPVDPAWDERKTSWIEKNKGNISADQLWRYDRTGNEAEANMMLQDVIRQNNEMKLLARTGITNTLISGGIAGIIDLDAPLMLLGGVSTAAKAGIASTRAARIVAGAAGGLATGTALGVVEQQTNQTADWTTLPVMGLGGMFLGGAGGLFSSGKRTIEKAANESISKSLNEIGETIAEGAPVTKRDLRDGITTHEDVYRSNAAREEELMQEEFAAALDAEQAKSSGKPAGEDSPSAAPNPADRAPRALTGAQLDEAAGQEGGIDPGTLGSELTGERASVGARQMQGTGPGINSIKSTRTQDMIKDAAAANAKDDLDGLYMDRITTAAGKVQEGVIKAANRFQEMVTATGLATDFDRVFRSGSEVGKRFAFDFLEHASGIIRNNRSASSLMEHYHKQMQGAFLPYNDAFDSWAKRQGANVLQRNFGGIRKDFDEALTTELNARWHDGPATGPNGARNRTVDKDVEMAADAVDAAFKRELELNKGKPGEGTTKGYDTMVEKSGYMPQKWSGAKINRLIAAGRTDKDIIKAVAEFYKVSHPNMSKKEAEIFADAAVTRARKNEEGISSNILADMADADSRKAIEDLMIRNGMPRREVDTLFDRLAGNSATRGQGSHTKQRLKIDMRMTASNGVKAMDLFDTDLNKLVAQRMRRGAGTAAMARKGITSRADRDAVIDAILEEQAANGRSPLTQKQNTGNKLGDNAQFLKDRAADLIDSDKPLTREDLLGIFSYFEGGPVNGGISPSYSRIMKLTRLATLNGLGLTQMAETATTIAGVGVKRFFNIAGQEIQDALKKVDSPLTQELKHMNILVPEEKMFRDDLTFDYDKDIAQNEWLARTDNMLNKAQRLQGFTSGFYAVRNMQQRIAVTAGVDKIVGGLNVNTLSPQRLRDIGLDATQVANIKNYIANGTIEFQQGSVKKLNLDKWDPRHAEDFALNVNRVVNQDIQKAMIGEGALMFHKDGLRQLFFQLKSFPMLAMEKQGYRHLRMMDEQAAMTFLYGLGTAAAVYVAKQTMNGRTENLTSGNIARGAFGMSNMTGWIPMWVDPLAGMLGMDDMKFNQYGKYGSTSVVSMPASFSVIDRMAQIPGRAATLLPRMIAGDGMSYDDVQALKATPIIGNAYGFSALFNAMQ